MSWPILTWKELELRLTALEKELVGLHVDRVIVPERPRHPGGYIKNEWIIRLTGRKQEASLLFAVRPRKVMLDLLTGKGPNAAKTGTQSAFGLALAKHLKGIRLTQIFAVPRERTAVLAFTGTDQPLALFISLIPSAPEAVLAEVSKDFSIKNLPSSLPVIARSRLTAPPRFEMPDGARAPANPEVRADWIPPGGTYSALIRKELEEEAFTARVEAAQRNLKERIKYATDRAEQSRTAAADASRESDWQRYGDLLKAVLHDPPPVVRGKKPDQGTRKVLDHATDQEVEVPCDPRLSPSEQVERFYRLARRRQRRESEARERLSTFEETLSRAQKLLGALPESGDWDALEQWERAAGLGVAETTSSDKPQKAGKKGTWLGRQFVSKNGWTIYVGKSKDENLELTFRIARGNDVWLHIRGRPGSHVVIPVQPGKSVPLETLLDAAHLCLFYSGGEKWGTTEIDYTQKKNVKRIRDSSEASYTQNKTLLIQPDPERLKRLLGSQK